MRNSTIFTCYMCHRLPFYVDRTPKSISVTTSSHLKMRTCCKSPFHCSLSGPYSDYSALRRLWVNAGFSCGPCIFLVSLQNRFRSKNYCIYFSICDAAKAYEKQFWGLIFISCFYSTTMTESKEVYWKEQLSHEGHHEMHNSLHLRKNCLTSLLSFVFCSSFSSFSVCSLSFLLSLTSFCCAFCLKMQSYDISMTAYVLKLKLKRKTNYLINMRLCECSPLNHWLVDLAIFMLFLLIAP